MLGDVYINEIHARQCYIDKIHARQCVYIIILYYREAFSHPSDFFVVSKGILHA